MTRPETPETKNATIESTFLGVEDHGIVTAILHLRYAGGGQGFGLRFFGAADKPIENPFGMEFVRQVLHVLEVDSWEKLPGTPCRVVATYGNVLKIGHYLKDQWFDPEVVATNYPSPKGD